MCCLGLKSACVFRVYAMTDITQTEQALFMYPKLAELVQNIYLRGAMSKWWHISIYLKLTYEVSFWYISQQKMYMNFAFLRWISEIKCREVIKWRHTHIHTHIWLVISIYTVKITSQATVAKQTAWTKRFSLVFKREKTVNFSQICNLNNETRFAYCIIFCGYI